MTAEQSKRYLLAPGAIVCGEGDSAFVVGIFGSRQDRVDFVVRKSASTNALPYVLGPAWVVAVPNKAIAEQIQKAIGGKVMTP